MKTWTTLLLILISLRYGDLCAFSCLTNNAKACKNKFRQDFVAELTALNINTVRIILDSELPIAKDLLKNKTLDDDFVNHLHKIIETLSEYINDLDENLYDDDILKPILKKLLPDLKDIFHKSLGQRFRDETKKRRDEGHRLSVKCKLLNDISKCYIDMYNGLRVEQLRPVPEYTELRNILQKVRKPNLGYKRALKKFNDSRFILKSAFRMKSFDETLDFLDFDI